MSLVANEQYAAGPGQSKLRFYPRRQDVKTFAAGSGSIAKLSPVTYNETTGYWQIWSGKHNEIDTISSTGTISGGTWTITVDGHTTTALAHSASGATIQLAINALGITAEECTVTGGPLSTNTSVVLTFGGKYLHKVVTVTSALGSLTGGGSGTFTQTQAGVSTTGVRGFMFEDLTLAAGGQSTGIVIMAGDIHYDDIPLPAGETQSVMQNALRADCRHFDLIITGTTKVR